MPEFRHESTAVSTTAFMSRPAAGMPIDVERRDVRASRRASASFHGQDRDERRIEPTKKSRTREMTALVALAIACCGSSDSAAAIVTISAAHEGEDRPSRRR